MLNDDDDSMIDHTEQYRASSVMQIPVLPVGKTNAREIPYTLVSMISFIALIAACARKYLASCIFGLLLMYHLTACAVRALTGRRFG
jgi:hypothetical protein